jgi:hypothetical protein
LKNIPGLRTAHLCVLEALSQYVDRVDHLETGKTPPSETHGSHVVGDEHAATCPRPVHGFGFSEMVFGWSATVVETDVDGRQFLAVLQSCRRGEWIAEPPRIQDGLHVGHPYSDRLHGLGMDRFDPVRRAVPVPGLEEIEPPDSGEVGQGDVVEQDRSCHLRSATHRADGVEFFGGLVLVDAGQACIGPDTEDALR